MTSFGALLRNDEQLAVRNEFLMRAVSVRKIGCANLGPGRGVNLNKDAQ